MKRLQKKLAPVKRSIKMLLMICLSVIFGLSTAYAAEPVDPRYAPILEAWNAANGEELWHNVLVYYWETYVGDGNPPSMPLAIRFGGTTEQLIADQASWDLAIVSSNDVDLQKMADQGLILSGGYVPSKYAATTQWLYPERLQSRLPDHPILIYDAYFYDYDAQTGDATLLICQADTGKKEYSPVNPKLCAQVMLEERPAAQMRAVEGIARAPWTSWTPDELLKRADEWDIATLSIKAYGELDALDQAGLLYDFANDPYWLSRDKDWPAPNGIFSADGRMIAIPYAQYVDIYPNPIQVMVVNARGVDIGRALAYEKHWMKSYEWMYDKRFHDDTPAEISNKYGISIYKDQVDW